MTDRRAFLAMTAAGLAATRARADEPVPATGPAVPGLEPFDELMTGFVRDKKIPGAALAVARRGRLVYSRGFGYADPAAKTPVKPDALFRIASVSKPLMAVAVLRLAETGKFRLDDPVLPLTGLTDPAPKDARWNRVTVRQCLRHTGGWDRGQSFDPIGRAWQVAVEFGKRPPIGPELVIRYMLARPLDFDPGERYAYSNLGYLLLGRVIAAASGKPYEEYVRSAVLAPLGVTRARLGRALAEDRFVDEVRYFDRGGRRGPCLYPPKLGREVPWPDGADNFEAYEAHGGWVASAEDLVRFAVAFDAPDRCPVLSAKSVREMFARPDLDTDGAVYALGWMVRPVGENGRNTWHAGFIPGSESLLVRRHDGLAWAVLFNTQNGPSGGSLTGAIDGQLHQAADRVAAWPAG